MPRSLLPSAVFSRAHRMVKTSLHRYIPVFENEPRERAWEKLWFLQTIIKTIQRGDCSSNLSVTWQGVAENKTTGWKLGGLCGLELLFWASVHRGNSFIVLKLHFKGPLKTNIPPATPFYIQRPLAVEEFRCFKTSGWVAQDNNPKGIIQIVLLGLLVLHHWGKPCGRRVNYSHPGAALSYPKLQHNWE